MQVTLDGKARSRIGDLRNRWRSAVQARVDAKVTYDLARLGAKDSLLSLKEVSDNATQAEVDARKAYYDFVGSLTKSQQLESQRLEVVKEKNLLLTLQKSQ